VLLVFIEQVHCPQKPLTLPMREVASYEGAGKLRCHEERRVINHARAPRLPLPQRPAGRLHQ